MTRTTSRPTSLHLVRAEQTAAAACTAATDAYRQALAAAIAAWEAHNDARDERRADLHRIAARIVANILNPRTTDDALLPVSRTTRSAAVEYDALADDRDQDPDDHDRRAIDLIDRQRMDANGYGTPLADIIDAYPTTIAPTDPRPYPYDY